VERNRDPTNSNRIARQAWQDERAANREVHIHLRIPAIVIGHSSRS
jgi:hypothetical protein